MPARLKDFSPDTINTAVEALHVARTGADYFGRPLSSQSELMAKAVRAVHIWEATRYRLALAHAKNGVECTVKLLEAWSG